MCLQYHTSLTNPSYPVLITGSYDRTVRVWNLDTGALIRSLTGHTRAVRALHFDQMLLFTGSMDGTVRMWNWRAGECLRVLEGHTDGVVSLNYNGYLLATGSADSTINVWNFRTGNKITLRGHEDWVNSVLLWDGKTSPGDMDPTIMPAFTKSRGASSPAPGASSNKNPNEKDKKPDLDPGAMLFSGSDDGTIKLWDLATETCIRTFEGHKAQIQSIKLLMVDMTESEIAEKEHQRIMRKRAISPPGPNGSVFMPANNIHTPSSPPSHAHVDYEPHAHIVQEGPSRVQPKVFVHATEDAKKKAKKATDEVEARQKKAILATGSLDGTIKLWDVDTGEEQQTLFGHIEGVWGVDMDALRMASASHGGLLYRLGLECALTSDRTIKVWDRESGNCEQTLVGHRGAVTSLQLSDDMIVSGSGESIVVVVMRRELMIDDGDVMIWNFGPSVTACLDNMEGNTPTPQPLSHSQRPLQTPGQSQVL